MQGGDALTITANAGGIALEGEIDAHTAPQLANALRGRSGLVTVDMSGVEFVDSSGLRVVIEAHQGFERDGGRLVLSNLSPAVQRLLEISGLLDHLHVEASTD